MKGDVIVIGGTWRIAGKLVLGTRALEFPVEVHVKVSSKGVVSFPKVTLKPVASTECPDPQQGSPIDVPATETGTQSK